MESSTRICQLRIESLDRKIVKMLNERAKQHIRLTTACKKNQISCVHPSVFLKNVAIENNGPLTLGDMMNIYEPIMKAMDDIEENMPLI